MRNAIFKRKKSEQRDVAMARIKELFEQADSAFPSDKSLSKRYVKLAREIAMKFKIRIPRELKRRFCKHCFSYLVPGKNLVVRLRQGKIVYHCKECKGLMRFQHTTRK